MTTLAVDLTDDLVSDGAARHAWRRRAACRGMDPRIFDDDSTDLALADATCKRCPVRDECLTDARDALETATIRGGMSKGGRHKLWLAARPDSDASTTKRCATCGTHKPRLDFAADASRADGLEPRCRPCLSTERQRRTRRDGQASR